MFDIELVYRLKNKMYIIEGIYNFVIFIIINLFDFKNVKH